MQVTWVGVPEGSTVRFCPCLTTATASGILQETQ